MLRTVVAVPPRFGAVATDPRTGQAFPVNLWSPDSNLDDNVVAGPHEVNVGYAGVQMWRPPPLDGGGHALWSAYRCVQRDRHNWTVERPVSLLQLLPRDRNLNIEDSFPQSQNCLVLEIEVVTHLLADELSSRDPLLPVVPTARRRIRQVLECAERLEHNGAAHAVLRPELLGILHNGRMVWLGLHPLLPVAAFQYRRPEDFGGIVAAPASSPSWSAGVISYMILTNLPPHQYPSPNDARFRGFTLALRTARDPSGDHDPGRWAVATLRGQDAADVADAYRLHRRALLRLGEDAVELVTNLLHSDPSRRWTAARALRSNFFNNRRPTG